MKALPVQPEPLWRTDRRERIAVSLWFLPTIFAVAAIAAAVTLGLFLATFVFSVIVLVSNRAPASRRGELPAGGGLR